MLDFERFGSALDNVGVDLVGIDGRMSCAREEKPFDPVYRTCASTLLCVYVCKISLLRMCVFASMCVNFEAQPTVLWQWTAKT